MATGSNKRLVWNTKELVTSTDLMRAQSFSAYDIDELLRYWLNVQGDVGAQTEYKTALASPPPSEVLNGLLPLPQLGGKNLFISPGVALMADPDVSPNTDDSPYKLIVDPGVPTASPTLQLTTNGGGSPRIDIIECSRLDTALETANVNIYNVSTGNFSPASLTKSAEGRMVYRIRTGVIGGGLPVAAAGWLPLAVVSVPAGGVNWDDCAVWDVRPLVTDRVLPSKRTSGFRDHYRQLDYKIDRFHASPKVQLFGQAELELFGYRLGGTLRPGSPGALEEDATVGPPTLAYIDLADNKNYASDFAAAVHTMGWAYIGIPLGTDGNPFGARWVKYTKGTTAMVPREPRGIFCVSPTPPVVGGGSNPLYGPGTQLVKVPTATGLETGSLQMAAVCIAGLWQNSGPEFVGGFATNRVQHIAYETAAIVGDFPGGTVLTALPSNAPIISFSGAVMPSGARSLRVRIAATVAVTNELLRIYMRDINDATKRAAVVATLLSPPVSVDWIVDLPLEPVGTFSITPRKFSIETAGASNITALSVQAIGWQF